MFASQTYRTVYLPETGMYRAWLPGFPDAVGYGESVHEAIMDMMRNR